MPSKRKSKSSRANGAKSRGPVTPEGKARSSRNAIKHGLNSRVVVLPHEDRASFEHLRTSYLDRFQPANQPEADLVETMASARWRLNRLVAIETKLFEKEMVLRDAEISEQFMEIDGEGKLACVFERCANEGKSLAMLMRYEGQLNRTYDRAFKQLQILQKPAPPAVGGEFTRAGLCGQTPDKSSPSTPPKELQNEPTAAPPGPRVGVPTSLHSTSEGVIVDFPVTVDLPKEAAWTFR
jgi:hypothetical protein